MLTRIVVDRSETEAALAMGFAWIAFVLAVPVSEPGVRPFDLMVHAAAAAGLVVLGFAAASRVRPMSNREGIERLRFAGWSLSIGALIGITNLAVNLGMASLHPTVHRFLLDRLSQLPRYASTIAAPVIEEVSFRLFFMSAVALVVAQLVEDQRVVFWTALAVSTLVFGLMHILRPMPESLDAAWIYRSGITLKSGFGGLLLGWIFWRWGLGYAIACHFAANAAHLLLEPLVLGA